MLETDWVMTWFIAWLGPWWKKGHHVVLLSVTSNADKEHVLCTHMISALAELGGLQPEHHGSWLRTRTLQASESSGNNQSPTSTVEAAWLLDSDRDDFLFKSFIPSYASSNLSFPSSLPLQPCKAFDKSRKSNLRWEKRKQVEPWNIHRHIDEYPGSFPADGIIAYEAGE